MSVPLTPEVEEAIMRFRGDDGKRALFAYHGIPYDAMSRAILAKIERQRGPWMPRMYGDDLSAWRKRRSDSE